jgi:KaiC/GvpD/RAD55 family RecA-like ATPase
MSNFIKTNISRAYWCAERGFEPAEDQKFRERKKEGFYRLTKENDAGEDSIAWFDNLFEGGGIEIPDDKGKPLIMLLSGPPGSGKTTLALELCLRVAIAHGFWSLYISTESETEQLKKKISGLGIKGTANRVWAYDKNTHKTIKKETDGFLTIYGQENIQRWDTFSEIVRLAIEDIVGWITKSNAKTLKKLLDSTTTPMATIEKVSPDILVFDNLNIIKSEDREEFFEKIVKGRYTKTKLIVVILDSHAENKENEIWEFACDTIVRLDYSVFKLDETSLRDYYLRQIEVVKARYQAHISGKQQLKIYSPFQKPDKGDENYDSKMRRAHPYREEGGIFIYPSIHYYLSEYKRRGSALEVKSIPTPCKNLNEEIDGFPEGRCTALIGCRGAHKSHLGYLHLLERVTDENPGSEKEAGIIVSLRDDERMTRTHLTRILSEKLIAEKLARENDKTILLSTFEEQEINKLAEAKLDRILKDMDLEILYFPPGYITGDEFFHRMFMSVYRLKQQNRKITMLFNSLDQISARFPLCAHQPIFVPAMIESLSGENVTSMFIAVDEPGQPSTQYGLLPMADLILTFNRYKVREIDYFAAHKIKNEIRDKDKHREAILLEVSRYAGGQKAGTKGLWELKYYNKPSPLIKDLGLNFTKWDFEYFK